MTAESQSVVPMIAYEDGAAALAWLARVFGFVERMRLVDADGRLTHAEMDAGDGVVMLASPTPEYEGPRRHRDSCAAAARWSSVPYIVDGVLVYVDDVEVHFARATAGGATILTPLEEGYPGRRYRAEDLEGHRWMFLERAR
jgi:PhnB protein